MKIKGIHYLYLAAALALALGIALTLDFWRRQAGLLESLHQRAALHAELQALQAAEERYLAALKLFAALPNTEPLGLAAAAAALPNALADIRELESRPLERGWLLRRSEIIFNDISLDQAFVFLEMLQARRPPWLLQECSITASAIAAGQVRLVVVVGALSKVAK